MYFRGVYQGSIYTASRYLGRMKNCRHNTRKIKLLKTICYTGKRIHGFCDAYEKITLRTFSNPNKFKIPSDFIFYFFGNDTKVI